MPAQQDPNKPMGAQTKSPIFKNMTGGLNVREALTDIGDNEGLAVSNLVYYTAGALVRRGGWTKLYTNTPTSNPLLGCFQAVFNNSGVFTYYTVITDGTDVWQTSSGAGGGATWNKITGAFPADTSQPYNFVMMSNKMIMFNGVSVSFWTGSGNMQAMPAPGGGQIACPLSRIGIVWQNFLFWGGDGNNPARLYFSNLNDPTTYPSANFVDVPTPFDGDQINGLAILYGNLLTLKRFSVYILQGAPPANLILSRLNSSVGCVSPQSVIQVDNLVFFVSDRGLYSANLFNVRQSSYKVEPRYLAAIPSSSNANPIWASNYRPRSHIFVALNCRSLYTSAGTTHDRILAHDYFNSDSNSDPSVSEFIAGYTAFGLAGGKPTNPTAPSIMSDFFYPGTPSNNITTMASFYDSWLYAFTEGSLNAGGPADQINWMTPAIYPPTDFLTKFYDFGDPDMIKQVRWLWTTGQIYNLIPMGAGIVYNNSPTAVSFSDNNANTITIMSPNGNLWTIGVDDDGTVKTIPTTDTTFLTTFILSDSNGQNWNVGVDNDGAFDLTKTSSTAENPPILVSPSGFQFQLTCIPAGIKEVLNSVPIFFPDTTSIIPGKRVVVTPLINGMTGLKQAKYLQLYFQNIGILSQFSLDLIMKGRRN